MHFCPCCDVPLERCIAVGRHRQETYKLTEQRRGHPEGEELGGLRGQVHLRVVLRDDLDDLVRSGHGEAVHLHAEAHLGEQVHADLLLCTAQTELPVTNVHATMLQTTMPEATILLATAVGRSIFEQIMKAVPIILERYSESLGPS